jgi:two-component system NarL family sensor kinase
MKKIMHNPDKLHEQELNSRIEIQQRSLETYSKEIYENIGQILSLAKLQLQSLQQDDNKNHGNVHDTGYLISKAISDLRSLTKQLSPEEIIRNGFSQSIITELNRLTETGFCKAEYLVKGNPTSLGEAEELIVFCVLQRLIYPALDIYKPGSIGLLIKFARRNIDIGIKRELNGEPLFLDMKELLLLKDKLKSINGDAWCKDSSDKIVSVYINF